MDLMHCTIAIYVYMNICNIDCNGCGDSDTSNTVAAIVLIGIRTILLQWCVEYGMFVCIYMCICIQMYVYVCIAICMHTYMYT